MDYLRKTFSKKIIKGTHNKARKSKSTKSNEKPILPIMRQSSYVQKDNSLKGMLCRAILNKLKNYAQDQKLKTEDSLKTDADIDKSQRFHSHSSSEQKKEHGHKNLNIIKRNKDLVRMISNRNQLNKDLSSYIKEQPSFSQYHNSTTNQMKSSDHLLSVNDNKGFRGQDSKDCSLRVSHRSRSSSVRKTDIISGQFLNVE